MCVCRGEEGGRGLLCEQRDCSVICCSILQQINPLYSTNMKKDACLLLKVYNEVTLWEF